MMRVYLDDDSAAGLLVQLLRRAGHDAQIPADVGRSGAKDPVHFTHAITESRVLLTRNYGDFEDLHDLIVAARGHHPGILLVRRDNDPSRDMTPRRIVRAIHNLEAAGVSLPDGLFVLNHWR